MEFNDTLRQWIETPAEDRDLAAGAALLLQLTRNRIQYDMLCRDLERHREFITRQLKKYFNFRTAPDQARLKQQAAKKVERIAGKYNHGADESYTTGKRADHDTLPEEVKAIYVEQADLRAKMRNYHAELMVLARKNTSCAAADFCELTELLAATDKKYRANWKKYDTYGRDED